MGTVGSSLADTHISAAPPVSMKENGGIFPNPEPPGEGMEQLVLPLTRPREPGILILQHHKGKVTVTGYDGEVVVVNAALKYPPAAEGDTGTRPVSGHALKLHAMEKENVVTVSTNSHERTIDMEIQVPYQFSLYLDKLDEGSVNAYYLQGEMEINSTVGEVVLTDISGSAVISSVDGDIRVSFSGVTPHVPMVFTSVGGDIDVAFPPDVQAVVKMRTDYGEILSDFDIEITHRKAETDTSRTSGVKRAFLEKWTYGTLGSGGPQYLFRSYHGNITIIKSRNLSPPGQ